MKNKILSILLSAVVAFGLWLYVITVVNPESEKTYYDIPVVLQNKEILAERGLMVVSDTPTVTLVLKGNRTTLNDLNEANINVITNVAYIEGRGTHRLTYDISFPGNVSGNEIAVQSSSTDSITLEVENKINKIIPVVVEDGDTSVPQGFIASAPQLDKTSIEISGPEPVMDKITQAVIGIDLSDQTKTLVGEYQYSLCDQNGSPVDAEKVSTNTEKINMLVKIERLKNIALDLEVVYGGGATEENTTVNVSQTTLQVSGSDTLLEKMDSLDLGVINLAEIAEDTVLTFPITLPEGVTNQTGVEQVTVEIKFNKLVKKEFKVSTITPVNVPAGMNVELVTKSLRVIMRGTERQIRKLESGNISVTVDFTGAQVGAVTINGTITVSSDFAGVGAVGIYPITATVSN